MENEKTDNSRSSSSRRVLDVDQIVERVAQAAVEGRLLIFVGTGFSKRVAGAAVVLSWEELLKEVGKRLNVSIPSIGTCGQLPLDYPEIASQMVRELDCQSSARSPNKGDRVLKEEIAKITIWQPDPTMRRRVGSVLRGLNPAAIVTTNYDEVLETSLSGFCCRYDRHDRICAPDRNAIAVWHLHGSCRNPQDIVVTREDYKEFFRPGSYPQTKLSLLLHEYTTLFVGYSLNDWNLLVALDWATNVYKSRRSGKRMSSKGLVSLCLTRFSECKGSYPVPSQIVLEFNEKAARLGEMVSLRNTKTPRASFVKSSDVLVFLERIAARARDLRSPLHWPRRDDQILSICRKHVQALMSGKYRRKAFSKLSKDFSERNISPLDLLKILEQIRSRIDQKREEGANEKNRNWLSFLKDGVESLPLDRFPCRLQNWLIEKLETWLYKDSAWFKTLESGEKRYPASMRKSAKQQWKWLYEMAGLLHCPMTRKWIETFISPQGFPQNDTSY